MPKLPKYRMTWKGTGALDLSQILDDQGKPCTFAAPGAVRVISGGSYQHPIVQRYLKSGLSAVPLNAPAAPAKVKATPPPPSKPTPEPPKEVEKPAKPAPEPPRTFVVESDKKSEPPKDEPEKTPEVLTSASEESPKDEPKSSTKKTTKKSSTKKSSTKKK